MAEWNIDLSEVNGLRHWYRDKPRLMQKASAMLLNNFAFGTRDEAVRQIGRLMTVRNERFVRSRVQVTKTTFGTPIAQQRSHTGSLAIPKGTAGRGPFSGWTEQETGARTTHKRIAMLASRKGDIQRQMIPRSRLKPAQEVVSIKDFRPKSSWTNPTYQRGGSTNYGGFIAMLTRQGFKGLINIKGGLYLIGRKGRGLDGPPPKGRKYVRSSSKLTLVQALKQKQPRQKHWLRRGRAIYFSKNPPERTWSRTVDRLLRPPGKK